METIDLLISDELKDQLLTVLDLEGSKDWELALVKGQENGVGLESWCMTVVMPEQAQAISKGEKSYIEADGLAIFISHPELASELDGKYLDKDQTLICRV